MTDLIHIETAFGDRFTMTRPDYDRLVAQAKRDPIENCTEAETLEILLSEHCLMWGDYREGPPPVGIFGVGEVT